MVEMGSSICRALGLPKSLGQIFGYLYFSSRPLNLDDIASGLGISKASASNGIRRLQTWGAVRRVWVAGDRKDYFEAIAELDALVEGFVGDFLSPRFLLLTEKIGEIQQHLAHEKEEGNMGEQDAKRFEKRLQQVVRLQKWFERAMPVLKRIL